jgi:hypothetical protein
LTMSLLRSDIRLLAYENLEKRVNSAGNDVANIATGDLKCNKKHSPSSFQ